MTESLVGNTDDRVVGDAGMLGARVFARARIDVLATGDDHVVFPADDEQPARIVEIPHISGPGHAVDDGIGFPNNRAPRVALTRQLAADEDASGHAGTDGPAVFVEDAYRAAGDRLTDGLGSVPQIGRGCEGADPDLGGAVAVVQDVAVGIHESLTEGGVEPVSAR